MGVLSNLEPRAVFCYFEEICGIPHGSRNMEQISVYCVDFAKAHGLRYRRDDDCNVIIWKDATPGYEHTDPVILQGHLDMVTVKDADCALDLEREGVLPAVDGDWVFARGTSLGGDDGIAVAFALAILAADDIPHPPLEAVFTVNEEIGLLGAASLDTSDLKGKILMNLDSEDEGIFLVGCAGGATADCILPAPKERAEGAVYEWRLTGLLGGHSGTEIDKERANACLIFGRYLMELRDKVSLRAGEIAGGEKDNAIAKFCSAVLAVPEAEAETLERETAAFAEKLKKEYTVSDPDFCLTLRRINETEATVIGREALASLTDLLVHLPAGVQRRIPGMPEMVQTSLNPGVLSTEDGKVVVTCSVRSSVASEKEWLLKKIASLTELCGGHCRIGGVYPAWEYRPDSRIRSLMTEVYEDLFGMKPKPEAIHAGVECGIFCEKLPGIDCISYGPQMHNIHTTRERLSISSVRRTWELTLETLKRMK